jgi:hypothetical protein
VELDPAFWRLVLRSDARQSAGKPDARLPIGGQALQTLRVLREHADFRRRIIQRLEVC